jgi:ribonuclease-3
VAGLLERIRSLFTSENALSAQLAPVLGFTPRRPAYYRSALTHRSREEGAGSNNERLEFLGDAILGSVVAEYLYMKYPMQDEGFLTEMRSRIVCRESLNAIAMKMGLDKMVDFNRADRSLGRSHIFGNALEALIGAIYLDIGWAKTSDFIRTVFLKRYVDIDTLEITDTNYKNQLMSWAQRQGGRATYELLSDKTEGPRRIFTVAVMLGERELARGTGYTKKAAEQMASQKALEGVEKLPVEAPPKEPESEE